MTKCVHYTIIDDRPGPDGLYHARCQKCGKESRLPGSLPMSNAFGHPYPLTVKSCMAPATAMKLTSPEKLLVI